MAQFRNEKENLKRSVTFGREQAIRPHSVGRELNDLREDVESAFVQMESHTGTPVIYSGNSKFSATDRKVTGGTLYGKNFLGNQTKSTLTIGDLQFTSVLPGTGSNSLTIQVTVANANDPLLATQTDDALVIRLAADGAGAPKAADNLNSDIVAAVNTASLGKLQAVRITGADGDTSFTAAVAVQNLSGGTGDGASLTASWMGVEQDLPINTMTDTVITVKDDGNTGFANGSMTAADSVVGVYLTSNRAKSNVFHAITVP
tara:strand:+ start:11444 stop:12223 length:780 start_codon:yes stop_codon:yes gene_type:complete